MVCLLFVYSNGNQASSSTKMFSAFTSSKWIFSCVYFHVSSQDSSFIKLLTTFAALNGFSPVCIFMCQFRSPVWLNVITTLAAHKWLFSGVHFCVSSQDSKTIYVQFNQTGLIELHINGFSAVCILVCKCTAVLNCLLHSLHVNFFILCVFSCDKSNFQLD